MQQLYEQLTALLLSDQQKFYRLAYSYCHDPETTMDIVQSAACKALEKYTTLKEPAYLKTWFYRILINESLDYLRRSKREQLEDTLPEDPAHKPLRDNTVQTAGKQMGSDAHLYQPFDCTQGIAGMQRSKYQMPSVGQTDRNFC